MDERKMGTVQTQFAELIWRHEPIGSGELVKLGEREWGWKKPTTYTVLRKLCERGITDVAVYDVSNTHVSYLIAESFKYSHIVLASVTYNLNIYPKMMTFLDHMRMLNVQNRYVGIIENGSWACTVGTLMHDYLEDEMKGMTILQDSVTINSSMTKGQNRSMDDMVDALLDSMKEEKK